MSIHPATRVLLLLVVAFYLPVASLPALVLLALCVLSLFGRLARSGQASWPRLRNGIWRLRWLLMAIFILYAGFTPGTPLVAATPGISREGLAEGGRRALVLLNLLVLVYLLMAVTPAAQWVVAVRTLLQPLRLIEFDPDRFGLRLALAFEQVEARHAGLRGQPQAGGGWLDRAAALVASIEAEAVEPHPGVTLPQRQPVRWWEWALPLALATGLYGWTP